MRTVAVYIVTYRRHAMLRRAIASVLQQTHRDLRLWVVNDDPADREVANIVAEFADARMRMFEPEKRRGATANFNLVFREKEADYSTLLEDDNWWEPGYLESQISALEDHPEAPIVVGNERIWKELEGGGWEDTGRAIWPFTDVRMHEVTLESLCGGAKLANSSMLVRTHRSADLLVPETIPVDVTEHYRERLMPPAFPLNGAPLVNYAETVQTARGKGLTWGRHQIALIGSVFVTLSNKGADELSRLLWESVASPTTPRATTLVETGLAIHEARSLVSNAPPAALARTAAGLIRRPARIVRLLNARRGMSAEIDFLSNAPLVKELVRAWL